MLVSINDYIYLKETNINNLTIISSWYKHTASDTLNAIKTIIKNVVVGVDQALVHQVKVFIQTYLEQNCSLNIIKGAYSDTIFFAIA